MQQLEAFCRAFHAAHYLPVGVCEVQSLLFTVGFPDNLPGYSCIFPQLMTDLHAPCVCMQADRALYGVVHMGATNRYLLIGPCYNGYISDDVVSRYMQVHGISNTEKEAVVRFLRILTPLSYNSFSNLIIYLHQLFNGEALTKLTHASISYLEMEANVAADYTERVYDARDTQNAHGSYHYELKLLDCIREGNTPRLLELMQKAYESERGKEGVIADDPLRQAKNLFICLVAIIGRNAAIPGGMDIEQTYHLMDVYIRECEKMQRVEDIHELNYSMLIDFTQRIQQELLPENLSRDVFLGIQFINKHLSEAISVQDVADHVKRSRSYLNKHFTQELGYAVGQYISLCRLHEAKQLLRHTNKSLSEISAYLCFSSQSYFQNQFKRAFGVTPARYRQKHEIEP